MSDYTAPFDEWLWESQSHSLLSDPEFKVEKDVKSFDDGLNRLEAITNKYHGARIDHLVFSSHFGSLRGPGIDFLKSHAELENLTDRQKARLRRILPAQGGDLWLTQCTSAQISTYEDTRQRVLTQFAKDFNVTVFANTGFVASGPPVYSPYDWKGLLCPMYNIRMVASPILYAGARIQTWIGAAEFKWMMFEPGKGTRHPDQHVRSWATATVTIWNRYEF